MAKKIVSGQGETWKWWNEMHTMSC